MRDYIMRKVNSNKRHVLDAVQVFLAGGNNGLRLVLDQIIHDRKIMGSQIPDHTHIMLKQAQVHPERVVVKEVANHLLVYELTDLSDGAGEQEREIDHEGQILPGSQFNELLGFFRGRRKRLFDEDMLAILEGGFRQLVMSPDRSDNGDRVNFRR